MIIKRLDRYLYVMPLKKDFEEIESYFSSSSLEIGDSIIDLNSFDIKEKGLLSRLKKIVKIHNRNNKSCVFIKQISISETSLNNLVFVPTIDEAKDFLRIEEIQRDLI
ncbi:MAG: hypothetical protein VX325_03335 [Bacteroidota bacterium]|nr:hypothetical protein [Bacteroidota bacterium]